MKDKKSLLIIIGGILVLLLIVLLIVSSTLKKQRLSQDENESSSNSRRIVNVLDSNETAQIEETINNQEYVSQGLSEDKVKRVHNIELNKFYFTAIDCIDSFNSKLDNLYKVENKLYTDEYVPDVNFAKVAYSFLDPIYISRFNISEDNINQMAGRYIFVPTAGFRSLQMNQIIIIYGYRINTINNTQEDYGYIVQLNESDKVFSIIPYEYMKSVGITYLQEGSKISLDDNKVAVNEYNIYSPFEMEARNIASYYLRLFKTTSINKPELAYERLTKDNKNKYGSASGFKRYIDTKSEEFNSLYVVSASEKKEGNYYTYTCIDFKGNNFYIKVDGTKPFEYSIELTNITL